MRARRRQRTSRSIDCDELSYLHIPFTLSLSATMVFNCIRKRRTTISEAIRLLKKTNLSYETSGLVTKGAFD